MDPEKKVNDTEYEKQMSAAVVRSSGGSTVTVPCWPNPRLDCVKEEERTRARSLSFVELDQYLKGLIRTIPDFPKPGMSVKDISTLLADPGGFKATIDAFARRYMSSGITHVASCESRGFIFGAPLAIALNCGFIPIRRARRLPGTTIGIDCTSGFRTDRWEVHDNAATKGDRIVIIDDMVSTGNTLRASHQLLTKLGAEVIECGCVIGVKEFRNEDLTKDLPLFTLITY